eukprot:scaffold441542_cov24-Prasinocladus_malaysianus.AAC.1
MIGGEEGDDDGKTEDRSCLASCRPDRNAFIHHQGLGNVIELIIYIGAPYYAAPPMHPYAAPWRQGYPRC